MSLQSISRKAIWFEYNYSKILKYDLKDNNTFLWFAKPKELIGVTSFFQGEGCYTCSAVAGEQPCKVIYFPKDKFINLLKHEPWLKHELLRMLCERINFMEMRTKNLRYKSIDDRIIETILFLVAKENEQNTSHQQTNMCIHYTKRELAEIVGASLEYLRKRIKALKSKKIIDYGKNWLLVNDMNKLKLITKG